MKYTSRLRTLKNPYTQPEIILPQPYKLFDKSLVNFLDVHVTTPNTKKYPLLNGIQLFRQVTGLNTNVYLRTFWDKLSDKQKEIFLNPPAKVHQHWVRISSGYEEASKILEESASENPFFHTKLYPWEIIKDKLRNKPAFVADVYDQLIHEVMNPPKKLFKPAALYNNFRTYFGDSDEPMVVYKSLPRKQRIEYLAISKLKIEFTRRISDFRRAQVSLRKGFNEFEKEYSREIGLSMAEPEKSQFIKQQWEHEKLSTWAYKRQLISREINLELQVAMIMDYIFEYNVVENGDLDWREWREKVSGGFHYLNRILFPYVYNVSRENIQEYEFLPKHLQWQRPVHKKISR